MNQLELVARSLLTHSKIIWTGAALGTLFSIFCLLFENSAVAVVFLAICGSGFGHSISKYKKWEGFELVPGLKQKHVQAGVGIVIVFWLISCLTIFAIHGVFIAGIGIAFMLIAYGVWYGTRDRYATYVWMICAVAFFAYFTLNSNGLDSLYKQAQRLSDGANTIIGLVGFHLGLVILFRFRKFVMRYEPPITEISTDRQVIKSSKNDIEKPAKYGQSLAIARLRNLLFPVSLSTTKEKVIAGVSAIVLLFLVFRARGNPEAVVFFRLTLPLLLISIPTILFMNKVPESLERLWIIGASGNKTSSARNLLVLAGIRSLIVFTAAVGVIAIQTPLETTTVLTTIFVVILSAGIGGLVLWLAAWRYSLWKRSSDGIKLMIIVLSPFILIAIIPFHESIFGSIDRMITEIGMYTCMLGVGMMATFCWFACIFDGAKQLARQTSIME